MTPPTYAVRGSRYSSEETLPERVTRRIEEKQQARIRQNGTFSTYNWRFDGRRSPGRLTADRAGGKTGAKCSSGP
jgi:hypothetical protein